MKLPSKVSGERLIIRSKRSLIILSLLIITPAGFLSKYYSGPAQAWFNNYFAGVLYETFWCLVVLFFWPDRKITKIAIGVLSVTSLLEILQLWHPWMLEEIRSTFMGRTLIGTTFSWWDFPHYVLGCLIGWFWMQKVG